LHDEVADDLARHLLVEGLHALPFDAVGDDLEHLERHRPLLARTQHAAEHLLPVERDALAVLLHHAQRRRFDALVGGVATAAIGADAAASDGEAIRAGARVDDAVVVGLAVGTAHG